MNTRAFNLTLMCFWIAICLGMLTREIWMPKDLLERVSGPQTPLVILLSGVLAAWNFMRFFVAKRFSGGPQQPSPVVEEYRRKIRGVEEPKVTDPQFKFDDPPNDSSHG